MSKVYFAGGFAPGTPALNRLRHLQTLPYRCTAEGLPSLSPAYPAFSLLYRPLSPDPRSQSALPQRGRGSPKVYFAGGFAPGTPALDCLRHLQTLPYRCATAPLAGNRFLSILRRTMGSAPGMQGAKPLA